MTVQQIAESMLTLSVDEAVERHQEIYSRFWDIMLDGNHILNPVNLDFPHQGSIIHIKPGKESLSWRFQTAVTEPFGPHKDVPIILQSEDARKQRIVEVVTRLKSNDDEYGAVYVNVGCWELVNLNAGDITLQTNDGRRYYKWVFDDIETHHKKQEDLIRFILHFLGFGKADKPKYDHNFVTDSSEGLL